ncbi:MAG: hypothetical protein M0R00_09420 [Candidatus Omnitrophica bacterium]|jgi:hypothetical protein|nr:hypothetical protein [Candidatus Omnitrophota bacterium]
MNLPNDMEDVLALITAMKDLGSQSWYEVVYYNGFKWCAYAGSETFTDGEQVSCWVYAKDAINNSLTNGVTDQQEAGG